MWRPYSTLAGPDGFTDIFARNPAIAYEMVIGIRRIFMSFRHTDMTGDPSIHCGWLDRIATGANPVFNAVLHGLIELEIVEREGLYYRLRLNKLNGYGLSYVSLRGSDFAESLKGLTVELSKLKVVKDALQESEKGED
jgi:hypothetical protein